MTFQKQIDDKIRFMVHYQDVTKRATRIAKLTKISLTTVYDWIKKIESDVDIFVVQPGRGVKPTITQEVKDNTIDKVTEKPTTSSLKRLATEYKISKSLTYQIIKESGREFKPINNSYHNFTAEEKTSRVEYCQNMLKRKGVSLDSIFFAHEMGINIKDTHTKHAWVFQVKKQRLKNQKLIQSSIVGLLYLEQVQQPPYFQRKFKLVGLLRYTLKEHKSEMKQLYPKGYTYIHDNSFIIRILDEIKQNGNREVPNLQS